jgi:hypothetical protein
MGFLKYYRGRVTEVVRLEWVWVSFVLLAARGNSVIS